MKKQKQGKTNGVRKILLMGVFWRILFIEAVLLVYSLLYRWWMEDAGALDLFWYAVRIIILVSIIIAFMMITLKKFLTHKIILPLESLARANKETQKDYSRAQTVDLPDHTPDEIVTIATSRTDMLREILAVSEERLNLVNFIRETFGRYLSKKVVNEILTSPKGHQIGGSRKTVTVLMSDLRGFTSLSESRDPEEMVKLLNRFLGKMSKIILKYDGIIDEIIGDAILAVFGAPDSHGNDPERAIACAIEMQNCLRELNREIDATGYPPLEMGIGINTGQVIVGNIGSELRMKYGIVGDTVNRVSRIESNSVGGQILIGDTTYNLAKEVIETSSPRHMMMKGLKEPLVFYSVSAINSPDYTQVLENIPSRGPSFPIRISLDCRIIQDKTINLAPLAGETRSMDNRTIHAVMSRQIRPYTDVKLNFNFCIEAHCFEDIYAKAVSCEARGQECICQFSITSMSEKDRQVLEEWSRQAADD